MLTDEELAFAANWNAELARRIAAHNRNEDFCAQRIRAAKAVGAAEPELAALRKAAKAASRDRDQCLAQWMLDVSREVLLAKGPSRETRVVG